MEQHTIVYVILFIIYMLLTLFRCRFYEYCCRMRLRRRRRRSNSHDDNDDVTDNVNQLFYTSYNGLLQQRGRIHDNSNLNDEERLEQRRMFIRDRIIVEKLNKNIDPSSSSSSSSTSSSNNDMKVVDKTFEKKEQNNIRDMTSNNHDNDNIHDEENQILDNDDNEQDDNNNNNNHSTIIHNEQDDNNNDTLSSYLSSSTPSSSMNRQLPQDNPNHEQSKQFLHSNNTFVMNDQHPSTSSSITSTDIIQHSIRTLCPICLGEFEQNDDICKSKNKECHHYFHVDCMMQWLIRHDECPLCRNNYLKDDNNDDDGNNNGNGGNENNGDAEDVEHGRSGRIHIGLHSFPITLRFDRNT